MYSVSVDEEDEGKRSYLKLLFTKDIPLDFISDNKIDTKTN